MSKVLERESFVFHRDWYNAIAKLEEKIQLEVFHAIAKEAFVGEQVVLSPMAELAMSFIEPQIERDTDKWLKIREKRKQSGMLGGRPQKPNESKRKQKKQMVSEKTNGLFENQTKPNESNSVSVSDNVSVDNSNVVLKEKEDTNVFLKKKTKGFVKPTVEEIQAYIIEKGYTFDAEAFFAFYESNGWKVGRNPMKNWKMACTTWSKNRNNNNSNNYGRETITDKIRRTIDEANKFSEQLRSRIGQQTDLGLGDSDEAW